VAAAPGLYKHVPAGTVDPPKMGLAYDRFMLRGPLREWPRRMIGEERLTREGYFQPGPIPAQWSEHLSAGATGNITCGTC